MTEPLDTDFLTDWSRDRQTDAWNYHFQGGTRCGTCRHTWHGLACSSVRGNSPCPCPSSFEEAS